MNRDNAKDFLPLVHALAEGKTIQYKRDSWVDAGELDTIYHVASEYRIKPELRTLKLYIIDTGKGKPVVTSHPCKDYRWQQITVQEVLP